MNFLYTLFDILKIRVKASVCGHKTFMSGVVTAYDGSQSKIKMLIKPEYCLACLEKMTIKCATCEKPIFIGNPISIAMSENKDLVLPDGAVMYNERTKEFITCLRPGCADSTDLSGHWIPPGKVSEEY